MGRPPFPKAKLRSFKVLVALNPTEAVAIRKAAGGVPLSVWIRDMALRAAARKGPR
jgi:hypothetical protein